VGTHRRPRAHLRGDRPLNSGKIGTLSYSGPETASHFWSDQIVGPVGDGAESNDESVDP
jgi:hypothetical protein